MNESSVQQFLCVAEVLGSYVVRLVQQTILRWVQVYGLVLLMWHLVAILPMVLLFVFSTN